MPNNKLQTTLFLDTTDFNKATFALGGGKVVKKVYKLDAHQSHKTLAKLEEFLKSAGNKSKKITKIVVNKGPGSFTGVRVGLTIALALGFAWQLPVKPVAKEKFKIS